MTEPFQIKQTLKYGEHHTKILMQLLIILSLKYRDTYRIVKQVSRYVSYREVSVSLQP